jgi:monoamine oxidase
MTDPDPEALIIGAGMAGLTAARALAESGVRVLVLEAQDRIGGRIHTEHIADEAIELGAEFIHGRSPELWALIEEAGLETYERNGAQICFEDSGLNACPDELATLFDPLEKLENFTGPDVTFAEYLDREAIPAEDRTPIIGYVEGFNAADHRQISAASLGAQQKAEDSIDGDRTYYLRNGYDQLPAYLARRIAEYKGSIRLATPVRELRWKPNQVEAITDTDTFTAQRAIITLPLGVLQSGSVTITPQPANILEAASRLRMGNALRFTLLFREPFWKHLTHPPNIPDLSFLFSFAEMPPVWWTPHPEPSNTITGWVGGPRSAKLADLNSNDLAQHACAALAKIFSLEPAKIHSQLLSIHTHNWSRDPYALGAYSYIAAGGLDAPLQMTEPVANTLFFAGEHTDATGNWGTVHAAIRSGLRAAAQIIDLPAPSL